jgi:thiamine biosynthesis lipoprotein
MHPRLRPPGPLALLLALALWGTGPGCHSPARSEKAPAAAVPTGDGATADAGGAPAPRIIVVDRKCMGTLCEIKAFHKDEAFVHRVAELGLREMDRIEALTTSWTDTSDVAHVNAAAGKQAVVVSRDTLEVVKKGIWVGELTAGAFDITVGVFKGLWRFDEDNDGSLPDPKEVRRRAKLVNYRDVIVDEAKSTVKLRRVGQRLNLEGLAKGYGVAAAVKVMRAEGLRDFIFHAGGDLYAAGRKGDRDWRVGIQDPRAPRGQIIFELSLSDKAFNTSGDYERFVIKDGVRYHHILDARTGFPARGCRSVTLLADDAFLADTLDTAIFAAGPKRGMEIIEEQPGVEGVIVDAHNQVTISSGLQGKLKKYGDPTDGI